MTEIRDLPVISLFSGAMGLDLGLERAGFRIAVALECNRNAVDTIRMNRPDLPLIDRPIETVTTEEILAAARLKPGEPFVVAGGPSCQVFSTAGARQSFDDPRGALFEHFARVVRESQPRFFVMENVRGLISAAAKHRPLSQRGPGNPPLEADEELGSAFRMIADQLRDLGYYTVFDVLNAADYGTPQTRQRLLLLGSRDAEGIRIPTPTHDRHARDGLKPWRTLRDAAGDVAEGEPEFYRFCPGKEKYLALIPEGGNWRDLPDDLKPVAMGRAFHSWGGRSGFFRRLAWDRPSPALTTRPDSKATSLCHPTELRPLSVREYARVQEFPDSWHFAGKVRRKYEQVGNAVPLSLGAAAGRAMIEVIDGTPEAGRPGVVECWNLDLLSKLTRRPRTIVNPPRMRSDTEQDTIGKWHKEGGRMRRDAAEYVPAELRGRFEELAGFPASPVHSRDIEPVKDSALAEEDYLDAAE
jgi:DNA (cytosine-5)-methyltransferase 1